MNDIVKQLRAMSSAPSDPAAFDVWLQLEDAIHFLEENSQQEEFVLYAGTLHCFVHAILVPSALVTPPDIEDLMKWSFNPSDSWGITQSFSPPSIYISPPLDHTGSKILNQGEQLVFGRHFDGHLGDKSYFEILQKFIHVSELHFIAERNAYCRLDERGDIEEVIRIVNMPTEGTRSYGGTVITIKRRVLDDYMAITDSVAVVMFDFTRFRPGTFGGWTRTSDPQHTNRGELSYRSVVEPSHGSYMRGFQIVRPAVTREAIIKRLDPRKPEDREYASFVAYDWKNRVVREISTAPGATANYFTKSDLPFEVSPAFFRPEVLGKYKADSEKYRLQDRSISCRGAWHLTTYDVNEAGQVHTYIVYLRDLPYEEQLYWKAYNEEPKAPISRRAVKTDFEGEWDLEYDPLESAKQIARELNDRRVPWWTLRDEGLLDKVHYPLTPSPDEWAGELLLLDQLIVEGFEEKYLRTKTVSLGRPPDVKIRSLKLTEECLMGLGFEKDHAMAITAPLHRLHELRSKMKGHASGEEAVAIRREAIKQHGTLGEHFKVLSAACDESLRTIAEAFKDFK